MEQLLNLVLPIFGVMLCGYLSGKLQILGQDSSHALNAFVYYFAMPLLLFNGMSSTDVGSLLDLSFITMILSAQLIVHAGYVLVGLWVYKRKLGELTIEGMAASWGNSIYMGFPLVLAAYGDEALPALVIIAVIQPMMFFVGSLVILDFCTMGGQVSALRALGRSLTSFLKNPAILAIFASILIGSFAIELPVALDSFVDLVAPAAAPCALFAIGLFLSTQRLGHDLWMVSSITLLKLIMCPLIMWGMAVLVGSWGFEHSTLWVNVAILLAATPTGTLVFVIAQKYKVAEERSSSSILVSSALSVVTIAVLLNWL